MRRDARPRRARAPLSALLSWYMQPSCQPGAGIGKAVPHPPVRHPVRPPRGPRRALGPPLARGLGWRHWGVITGPWRSLGSPARSGVAGYPLTQRPGGHTKACRCGGLFRQHISWMETALLGRFQPQTQQNGFASRKYSPLVKELPAVSATDMAVRAAFLYVCIRSMYTLS